MNFIEHFPIRLKSILASPHNKTRGAILSKSLLDTVLYSLSSHLFHMRLSPFILYSFTFLGRRIFFRSHFSCVYIQVIYASRISVSVQPNIGGFCILFRDSPS